MADKTLSKIIGGGAQLAEVRYFSSLLGVKFQDANNSVWLQSGTSETDDNELDPSLVPFKDYGITGGTSIFIENLGKPVASSSVLIIPSQATFTYFRSTNNGVTFNELLATGVFGFSTGLSGQGGINSGAGTILYPEGGAGAYVRSSNNGLTFGALTLAAAPSTLILLTYVTSTTWLAASNTNEMFRSTDDGINWVSVENTSSVKYNSDYNSTTNVVIVTGIDFVFRSVNSGASFTAIAIPSTAGDHRTIKYLGDNSGHTWIIASDDGQNYISTDDGLNWSLYTAADNIFPSGLITGIFSDGAGKVVYVSSEPNYSGTLDRGLIATSNDFGVTIGEVSSTVEMLDPIGFAEGDNGRLFIASKTYDALNSNQVFAFLDNGFGISDSTIGGATGYLRIK